MQIIRKTSCYRSRIQRQCKMRNLDVCETRTRNETSAIHLGIQDETLDAEGKKFRKKARCCLRRDRQQAYINYDPTNVYAPVASHDSIRMLQAITAAQKLIIEGADISNAYLYRDLNVAIIMEQPTDCSKCEAMPGHLCKLNKSLYGTKQAGEIWRLLLDRSLKRHGFTNSKYDELIYFFNQRKDFIILAIVEKDLAFASNSNQLLNRLKS